MPEHEDIEEVLQDAPTVGVVPVSIHGPVQTRILPSRGSLSVERHMLPGNGADPIQILPKDPMRRIARISAQYEFYLAHSPSQCTTTRAGRWLGNTFALEITSEGELYAMATGSADNILTVVSERWAD